MTDRVFLDTNVLVYLFDADASAKQRRVREILSAPALRGRLVLSTQVLQEFYVCVTRKLAVPLDPVAAAQAVRDLAAWPVVQIDPALILSAIARSRTAQLSFWDALIVEAALAGGATSLYSEDLQAGRVIEGLRISNPFQEGSPASRTR
jgi:predicted nucleic acid-binding protein